MNKIFTYFEKIPNNRKNEVALLDLWYKNWSSKGWKCFVLDERYAAKHPLYKSFKQKAKTFPTVNNKQYEYHCFVRWLAFSMCCKDGSEFICDYDLMNYGFEPPSKNNDKIVFYYDAPCLTLGNREQIDNLCKLFMQYEIEKNDLHNGLPHVSDMTVLRKLFVSHKDNFTVDRIVRNYLEEGWDKSQLVHYNNASVENLNRKQRILEIRPPFVSNKNDYKIYCMYHDKIFADWYKGYVDQITFVKMDKSDFVFESKNHINLHKIEGFIPIGKQYVEYEFYYNLYKQHMNGMELPEYLGFIQYDMEIYSNGISLFDFIDSCDLNENTAIYFQKATIGELKKQKLAINRLNCIDLFVKECGIEFNYSNNVCLCGAFFVHRNVFVKLMELISPLIETKRLEVFHPTDKRYAGNLMERYIAMSLKSLELNEIYFTIYHHFLTNHPIKGQLN